MVELRRGESPYPAVNLRRHGLRCVSAEYFDTLISYEETKYISCPSSVDSEFFNEFCEVIDMRKFLLSRIKIGF